MSFTSTIWNLGLVAFLASFTLDCYVARKFRHSDYRIFFAFLLLDAWRSAVMVVMWREYGFAAYSLAYWYSRPMYLGMMACVAGELSEWRRSGIAAGSAIALVEAWLVTERSAELLPLDSKLSFLVAAVFIYCACFKSGTRQRIASGFALTAVLALAINNPPVSLYGGPLRMVRVFAYVTGAVIWAKK